MKEMAPLLAVFAETWKTRGDYHDENVLSKRHIVITASCDVGGACFNGR